MTIRDHNQALDEHTALIQSLSPISKSDTAIRLSLLVSIFMSQINERAKVPFGDTGSLTSAKEQIDKLLGESTVEREVSGFISHEIFTLRSAETIFCAKSIVEEIVEAQETMLDTIILPQDVFVQNGFISLEKPFLYEVITLVEHNVWQKEQWEISGILFAHGENRNSTSGLYVYIYGHWRGLHYYDNEVKPAGERLNNPDSSFLYDTDTRLVRMFIDGVEVDEYSELINSDNLHYANTALHRANGKLSLVDATFFEYGEVDTVYDAEVLYIKKFLLAFFRLAYEYLEVTPTKVDKPFGKRAKRVGKHIPNDGYITVMTLRRKLYDCLDEAEKRNGPAYAFRVRGHWKKAYRPSTKLPVGHPSAYRHVYIKDYIKGRGIIVDSKRLIKVGD